MKRLSDKQNVSYGLILTYVSLFIALMGSFFITPIVLRNIGDEYFGLFSFCNSITSWLTIASTALGASFIFFVNKEIKDTNKDTKTNTLFMKILTLLSFAVLVFSAIVICILKIVGFSFSNYTVDQNNLIFILLFISSVQVSISILFSVFRTFNNYKKSFVFVRSTQTLVSILAMFLNIVLSIYTKSIISIALVSFGTALFNGLLNLFFALFANKFKVEKTKIRDNKTQISFILRYSSVILIATIVSNLNSNIDKTILGIMVDSKAVTMYQLSITFLSSLISISYSFSEVMQPKIFELYRKERYEELNKLFLLISKVQSIVVLLIIGGYISCGYHFVILWIDYSRIDVYYYTIALFVSASISLCRTSGYEIERANNKIKIPTLISVISSLSNLILSIILVKFLPVKYCVWACIIGTVFTKVFIYDIPLFFYDAKIIKLPVGHYLFNFFKIALFSLVSSFFSIILFFVLRFSSLSILIRFLLEGFLFVVVYFFLIFIFEKKFIKNSFLILKSKGSVYGSDC